ncbi:hypothetical protein BJX64DRAFT_248312 [Aspergillus heterothallicus]
MLCLSTAVGMLGNAANLSMILKWYAGFWEEDNNSVDLWVDKIILGINHAVMTLCKAFNNIKTAHRKVYVLTGSKKDQAVGALDTHDQCVVC